MKSKNEPIVLSGRVYLDGILAEDNFQLALPAKLVAGDIKLHNVNREGRRQRYGQTITFTGFIVATVYDGKRFRRLLLRKLGAVESTHTGVVQRRETASSMVRYLRTLVRRQAVWFAADHGFEVTRTVVAEAPVAPAAAEKTVAAPAAVEKSGAEVAAKPAVTAPVPANHGHSLVTRKRRSRRPVNSNQLELFDEKK
ncbi:MAG: hypothetical protein JSS83_20875 [Cyanobacteria bacterium SZAS LIN-3]|nr:hypothetical protein [Cyanobacteria bacterium SZAS LIN-3]MBS2010972.1 hypothetical protein [Cyanobacteria bacterium SZAS TMP-1]